MGKEAWALVGALVVAIVSGLLQLWVARQNRLHDSRERLRDAQRMAFADLFKWSSEGYAIVHTAIPLRHDRPEAFSELRTAFRNHINQGPTFDAAVRVVSSERTYALVKENRNALLTYLQAVMCDEDHEKHDELAAARVAADNALMSHLREGFGIE